MDDPREEALAEAKRTYAGFITFLKWLSFIWIALILVMCANNFLDDMNENERLFALLPLIHSENISDHEKAYELMEKYLKNHSELEKIKKFWLDHTAPIKKFGRYPHRNKVLNRVSSKNEIEFLNSSNSSW